MALDVVYPNIPDKELIPGVQMEIAGDNPTLATQNTLIIGQATVNGPVVPVYVASVARAVRLFGAGSQVASMVERYLAADRFGNGCWVLPLQDNAAGAAATGNIDFAGSNPTEAGTIHIYIAGRYVPVAVAKSDNAAAIQANVVAAINAYRDANDLGLKKKDRFYRGVAMPVTASAGTGSKVTLTANNKGTAGNNIDVQCNYFGARGQQKFPAGVSVSITAMSGGATDPDFTLIDSYLGDVAYDFIVIPVNTSAALDAMQAMMANDVGRWSWARQIFGHVFAASKGVANGGTLQTLGLSRNDPHMTIVGYEGSTPASDYDVAASFAGAFAVSSRSDPARPVQTLSLPMLLAPSGNRFSFATRQTLLGSGIALMDYNADSTCKISRAVTTYQLDPSGTPDESYRDAETNYTLMAVARRFKAGLNAAFPRSKLADDGTSIGVGSQFKAGAPNQAIATPKSIKATLISLHQTMESVDGWLTDTGTFGQNCVVQRKSTDASRVDILAPVKLVSGLRVIAVLLQFSL